MQYHTRGGVAPKTFTSFDYVVIVSTFNNEELECVSILRRSGFVPSLITAKIEIIHIGHKDTNTLQIRVQHEEDE